MKTQTVIAQTSRGHRVYLEGLVGRVGQRYNVTYSPARITIDFTPEGKRKVVARGVIDLEGKRVSTWKGLATHADIEYNDESIIVTHEV